MPFLEQRRRRDAAQRKKRQQNRRPGARAERAFGQDHQHDPGESHREAEPEQATAVPARDHGGENGDEDGLQRHDDCRRPGVHAALHGEIGKPEIDALDQESRDRYGAPMPPSLRPARPPDEQEGEECENGKTVAQREHGQRLDIV